jgi:hypothetical protein
MRQHYVPRWLLKKWADAQGRVRVHRKTPSGTHVSLKHPAQICYHKNGWTLTAPDTSIDRFVIEKRVTLIDTKADEVIARIDRDGISNLGEEGEQVIAAFCSSIVWRGPISIDMMRRTASSRFLEALATVSEPQGISNVEVIDITRRRFPHLIDNVGALLVGSLSFESKLVENLLRRQWMLCDFSKTSVGSIVFPDLGLIASGTRLDSDDSVIALPISPQKALYFSSRENLDLLISLGLGRLALATIESAVEISRDFVVTDERVNLNHLQRKFDQFWRQPV